MGYFHVVTIFFFFSHGSIYNIWKEGSIKYIIVDALSALETQRNVSVAMVSQGGETGEREEHVQSVSGSAVDGTTVNNAVKQQKMRTEISS